MHKLRERLSSRKNDTGFTLIELVITVVIIGILAAIAIPSYGAIQDKTRQNTVNSAAADEMTAIQAQLATGATPTAGIVSKAGDKITVDINAADPNLPMSADNIVVRAVWASNPSINAERHFGDTSKVGNDCGGPCVVS